MQLRALVFVSGWSVMAVEMTGLRLLAPFFGTSLIVTTVLITSMMIFLSAGYWIGGRQADRHPSFRSLCGVTLVAGLLVLLIPFLGQPVLRGASAVMRPLLAGKSLQEPALAVGVIAGGILSLLALMAAPVTLMGMVSPWAIRLAAGPADEAGRAAGRLYALGTMGSIVGSVLPALVLIPLLGVRNTFVLIGGLLVVVSALCRWGPSGLTGSATWSLALLPAGTLRPMDGLVLETESIYHFIQVVEEPFGKCTKAYSLYLNEGVGIHSVKCLDAGIAPLGYWGYMAAAPLFREEPQTTKAVLVVGLAGGTIAKKILDEYPGAQVDGVEIDAAVVEVGKRYFDNDDPRITSYVGDGRLFLQATSRKYDVVIVDAYRQPYIPFHLTTREFWTEVAAHLTADGVVAINVAGVKGVSPELTQMIYATMREVFPQVLFLDAFPSNKVLVAVMRPKSLDHARTQFALTPHPTFSRGFQTSLRRTLKEEVPGWRAARVLTDDQAPVELSWDLQAIAFVK